MPSLKKHLCASVSAFRKDKRGQIAVTLALSIVPMMSLVGVAVDYSNLVKAKTALQTNVDAVALGAQQQNFTTNAALLSYAQRFVPATSASYNSADGTMCVTAQQTVPTSILKIVRINSMSTSATACSANQTQTQMSYEIALALDNTGSMLVADTTTGKTKIASEITAAKNFVAQMFTAVPASKMQISLVPFTTAVNVGPTYATASWMDTQGKSSIHWENFPKLSTSGTPIAAEDAWNPQSRFDLFGQINQSWAGCVEERPQPYTLTDTPASSGSPDTLYVPMFAPDESDNPNSGYKSYNSYLNDAGGYCVSGDAYDTKDANGTFKDGVSFFNDNQQKLCKYAVKWAALNPSTTTQASASQNAISTWLSANGSPGTNNWTINGSAWGNYQLPAATVAGLIVANNMYSVASGTVNFCTNFSVGYNWSTGKYYVSSDNNYCYSTSRSGQTSLSTNYSTTLPSSNVTNPLGSSWTSTASSVTSSGWGATSSLASWSGSGWGYGGSGWGTGAGWGWGGGSGNSTGFSGSTTNPGQTATGASSNQYIGANQFNIGGGANSGCDATLQPLTTLTNNQTTLTTNLTKMVANGATNLVSGMMWAWRTISPNGPFAAGTIPVKGYSAANNKKIIVFMTDGFNNWEPDDSQNGGVYSAFGFYHNNRLGSLTVNGSSQTAKASNNRAYLDAAFLQACTNAKNAGVEIYTVAFTIPNAPIDQQGQDTVKTCASDASHYFKATNGTELNTFFQNIGQSLTQSYLRLKS